MNDQLQAEFEARAKALGIIIERDGAIALDPPVRYVAPDEARDSDELWCRPQ